MTDKIINLDEVRRDKEPHLSGRAMCLNCGHDWQAVAPIGTTRLECPECGLHKGAFRGTMEPESGAIWVCACGNDLFIVQSHRVMCAACGETGHPWAFTPDHPPCWDANPSKKHQTCTSTTTWGVAACNGCGRKAKADKEEKGE